MKYVVAIMGLLCFLLYYFIFYVSFSLVILKISHYIDVFQLFKNTKLPRTKGICRHFVRHHSQNNFMPSFRMSSSSKSN